MLAILFAAAQQREDDLEHVDEGQVQVQRTHIRQNSHRALIAGDLIVHDFQRLRLPGGDAGHQQKNHELEHEFQHARMEEGEVQNAQNHGTDHCHEEEALHRHQIALRGVAEHRQTHEGGCGDQEGLRDRAEIQAQRTARDRLHRFILLRDDHPHGQGRTDQADNRPVEQCRPDRGRIAHEEHGTEEQGDRAPLDEIDQRRTEHDLGQRRHGADSKGNGRRNEQAQTHLVVNAEHEGTQAGIDRHIHRRGAAIGAGKIIHRCDSHFVTRPADALMRNIVTVRTFGKEGRRRAFVPPDGFCQGLPGLPNQPRSAAW